MTNHRRPEIPFTDAPRGVCRWCGEDILFTSGDKKDEINRRRRWHAQCVDAYNATDPREARRRVRKRDRGRCATCGVDTYGVRRELRKIGRGRTRAIRERGYKPRQSFWELDHIVPLIDGGTHSDENLQTLCTPCHTEKSAGEARTRAARARAVPTRPQEASKAVRATVTSKSPKPETFEQLLATADSVNTRVDEALGRLFSN